MLTVQSATIGYGRKAIARHVSMKVQAGEIVAVLGTNGSGKSTLVKTLLGSQALLEGRLTWAGGRRPRPIAYLSQLTEFDRHFPMNVQTLVASGAWGPGKRNRATPEKVEAALHQVGLHDLGLAPIHELSGGQLQRARFARAIIQDASFIILDEPFAAVDQRRERQLLELIQSWAGQGRAVLLVLHDLSAALEVCTLALLLGEGGGDFGPTDTILTAERLVARGYLNQAQVALMHKAAHG